MNKQKLIIIIIIITSIFCLCKYDVLAILQYCTNTIFLAWLEKEFGCQPLWNEPWGILGN